jgi:uncharacterized protein YndB with AHSA1/START domain
MNPGPFAGLISDDLGQLIHRPDGLYDIVFERRLQRPVEKVWSAITIPERIADWFTAADLDLRLGGHYRLAFDDGTKVEGVIVEFEPLRRVAHTWPHAEHPDSVVRYELESDGGGCRLTLTQTAMRPEHVDVLVGWHTFLEALPGAADSVRTIWRREREAEIGARYRHLMPA